MAASGELNLPAATSARAAKYSNRASVLMLMFCSLPPLSYGPRRNTSAPSLFSSPYSLSCAGADLSNEKLSSSSSRTSMRTSMTGGQRRLGGGALVVRRRYERDQRMANWWDAKSVCGLFSSELNKTF